MTNSNSLSALWMFVLPLVAVLLPIWLGQGAGRYAKKRGKEVDEAPISSAVAGTIGLFAFMLAFTFQIVGDRYSKRKELFLNEISDIRNSYLFTGLIPEPLRSQARKLIVSYVDIRIEVIHEPTKAHQAISRSEGILDSLWNIADTLSVLDRSSESYSLFIGSVSRMVSLFNERITVTFQTRLPRTILYILTFVGFSSMIALGYHFGMSGKSSFPVNLLLGITFAAVMWLIFALDHPESGLITVDRTALRILQEQLHRH